MLHTKPVTNHLSKTTLKISVVIAQANTYDELLVARGLLRELTAAMEKTVDLERSHIAQNN